MTTAAEVFVVQLARASKKAKRFVQYLSKDDRDDVIAAAVLWCWEHKDHYNQATSLDTWFVNAVRHAYDRWQRGELRNWAQSHDVTADLLTTDDTTLATAQALEAAARLSTALPWKYRQVALLHAQGYTRAEMRSKGLSKQTIDEARARIRQMRRLVPDDHDYRRAVRATATTNSDDACDRKPQIDLEIEQLEAMPRHGADCPPCWRCRWFDGFLPGKTVSVRMTIREPDVAAAVTANETRKIEIAKRVRAGTLKEVTRGNL